MEKFVIKKDRKDIKEEKDDDDYDNNKMLEIKLLRDYIEKKMSINQKLQIINIIKEGNTKYTKNKNGYFVNMNKINDEILDKLKLLVNFTKDNIKDIIKTEEILNDEKNRIELIDKEEIFVINTDDLNEKNINFEIFSMEGVQSDIFDEFKEDYNDDKFFINKELLNDKRENSGYKIILKRYKKKYGGNKAKILKKFRDISKNSINSKSAKTTLIQPTTKKTKAKPKKELDKKEDTETGNIEDTNDNNSDDDKYDDGDE